MYDNEFGTKENKNTSPETTNFSTLQQEPITLTSVTLTFFT